MKYIDAIEEAINNCRYYRGWKGLPYGSPINQEEIDKALALFREFVEEINKIRIKCIDDAANNRMHRLPIDEFNEGFKMACTEILLTEVPECS